jgi:hypothetical protein
MDADDAWMWLIAILAVWCVLGAALFDLLHDTDTDIDGEPVSRYREPGSPDTLYGTTARRIKPSGAGTSMAQMYPIAQGTTQNSPCEPVAPVTVWLNATSAQYRTAPGSNSTPPATTPACR